MRPDLNLARRLAFVAFTDVLCWLPIGILGFLVLDGQILGGEAYAWMAVFVVSVNSALSPVLYSLPVIRNYLVKVITKRIALKKKKNLIAVNCSHSTHAGPNLHDVCVFSELELPPLALSLRVVSIWPITSTSALDSTKDQIEVKLEDDENSLYCSSPS
ncbi:hypothetical protein RRG08_043835 [Elysia crispata]|uniref:G-protein coupled receptors family 1 profile domain-containing protein n=1 Tax=Elysia crispata TaxID=231223 RepID=A0AAE0Z3D2_9GAST|nr:hypothetical protein RRG08_043835 [Elysia crispata]